jgi:hypothetical protein
LFTVVLENGEARKFVGEGSAFYASYGTNGCERWCQTKKEMGCFVSFADNETVRLYHSRKPNTKLIFIDFCVGWKLLLFVKYFESLSFSLRSIDLNIADQIAHNVKALFSILSTANDDDLVREGRHMSEPESLTRIEPGRAVHKIPDGRAGNLPTDRECIRTFLSSSQRHLQGPAFIVRLMFLAFAISMLMFCGTLGAWLSPWHMASSTPFFPDTLHWFNQLHLP